MVFCRTRSMLTRALLVVLLAGCAAMPETDAPPTEEARAEAPPPTAVALPETPPPYEEPYEEPPDILPEEPPEPDAAETLLETMTAEEKVGQLFVCAFRGEGMTDFNTTMQETLDRLMPCGVVLFSENIESKEQVSKLIGDLQEHSKIPLFIAADEEGGRVSRLQPLYDEKLPAVAELESEAAAWEHGAEIGRRLAELGFNMAFAPVADLNTNPDNTVIGDRAFGDNPQAAAPYISAAVDGIRSMGVISVVKHFPGHGDTKEDSHGGAAIAMHDRERLFEVELPPFAAGIAAGAGAVMVGHISVPNVTDDNLPATLSWVMVTDILRGEMGFDGVVITDAMDMGAITAYYPAGEAAVLTLAAGTDIVLMPQDPDAAYTAVLEAVDDGRISNERLDTSVLRVLRLKMTFSDLTNLSR